MPPSDSDFVIARKDYDQVPCHVNDDMTDVLNIVHVETFGVCVGDILLYKNGNSATSAC